MWKSGEVSFYIANPELHNYSTVYFFSSQTKKDKQYEGGVPMDEWMLTQTHKNYINDFEHSSVEIFFLISGISL